MSKLEKMTDWKKRKLSCHCCGSTRSTQYKICMMDNTEIYICKKCVLKLVTAVACGDIQTQKQGN